MIELSNYVEPKIEEKPVLYGWLSSKSWACFGASLYSFENGTSKIVTEVHPNRDYIPYWDDAEYMGPVGQFLRKL